MAVVSAQRLSGRPAFELKGTIAPVTVLCLCSTALDAIEAELRARVAQAPQMFHKAPIVIDVADVESELDALSLSGLLEVVRGCKFMPVGIAHLPADRIALAAEHDLAILQLGFGRSRGARATSGGPPLQAAPVAAPPAPAPPPAAVAPAPAPAAAPAPRVEQSALTITSPVRGGQVVYAQGTDLVVLAPVNPGAQVIADGHIHVYGRLMGRALAGAHGRADARVFCHSLEAELVSVCGEFITADDIPEKLRGKPAQMFVEHGSVRVAAL
ncbi:MAG TPA: septum site-determining protein MinC [Polyangia bacterium]|nr:septum site-determining protein MinC [Polyangia bacterium]